jgi:hypothetical protein
MDERFSHLSVLYFCLDFFRFDAFLGHVFFDVVNPYRFL